MMNKRLIKFVASKAIKVVSPFVIWWVFCLVGYPTVNYLNATFPDWNLGALPFWVSGVGTIIILACLLVCGVLCYALIRGCKEMFLKWKDEYKEKEPITIGEINGGCKYKEV